MQAGTQETVANGAGPAAPGGRRLLKRIVLGRPLATSQLRHERLGKPTALAIFASDNLSSVAYATEEILKVLVPMVGAAAFGLLLPISGVILLILATLLFSYRQTIKAYPSAGGAYIVTKDNFGLMTAQVAGVALLTDYVLTVAVSVAAGVQALTSAFGGLFPLRVEISVALIAVLAVGNLRGVKESGKIFAAPTYFFIVSMFVLITAGIARALTGNLQPAVSPFAHPGTVEAASLFLILKAFSSGGAAVTGVEAISNGVPAFKPPEWRNARTTLMWMGSLLGVMFMGLSFLAHHLHVFPDPSEKVSIVAQVARQVFGAGPVGHVLFYGMQAATMLILVLAANTSFADFPRLANFHAADNFLPRQFTKRGSRLVFSNGIIALAVAAAILVIAFKASVSHLIPFYAIGVFTSFTLSQAGMAKRHLRLREPGWKTGLAINGFGALATGVVDIVIAATKFTEGAWAVIVLVPVMVALLVRMNHQYEDEARELEEGLRGFEQPRPTRHAVVVLVDEIDGKTLHAVRFAKTIAPDELRFVHLATDVDRANGLAQAWELLGAGGSLDIAPCEGRSIESCVARYIGPLATGEGMTTVVVPAPPALRFWQRVRSGRPGQKLTKALSAYPTVTVSVVRDPGPGYTAVRAVAGSRPQIVGHANHVALVLVDHVDRSILRAVRYAEAIRPHEIRCLHVAIDTDRANRLFVRWADLKVPFSLETVLCEDRDLGRCLSTYVDRLAEQATHLTVVMPRHDYSQAWHRLLHDRTRRIIATALLPKPNLVLTAVPYHLGRATKPRDWGRQSVLAGRAPGDATHRPSGPDPTRVPAPDDSASDGHGPTADSRHHQPKPVPDRPLDGAEHVGDRLGR
jgi:amino acid transporter